MSRPRKRSLPNSKVRVNKRRKRIPGGRKSEKRQSFLKEYKPKNPTVEWANSNGSTTTLRMPMCWQPDGTYGQYNGQTESGTICPPGYLPGFGNTYFIVHEHHVETGWTLDYEQGQCICHMMMNPDSAGGQGGKAGS